MTRTVGRALAEATKQLQPVAKKDSAREAAILLGHVLSVSATELLSRREFPISDLHSIEFQRLVAARALYQPISQLIGRRAFWEHEFIVTPDVLDPRPETELLVELALKHTKARRVLDLGTGSGCILCSVLYGLPEATGVGVDTSGAALEVAARNADALRVAERCSFRRGAWFDAVDGQYDLILSNPPYISDAEYRNLDREVRNWEPKSALTDEGDGLVAYRGIAEQLSSFLAPGGVAYLEHGWQQSDAVVAIFRNRGFETVTVHRDLSGRKRVVGVAAKSPSA